MKRGLASSAVSDVPREIVWYLDVRGFDPAVRQHSFMGIGHEIILGPLSPTGVSNRALSTTDQKMYTLVLVYLLSVMHQSSTGLGNSGDIDFPLCKARVYVQQCGDISMVKALLKSRQVILKLARPIFGHETKAALFPVTAETMLG